MAMVFFDLASPLAVWFEKRPARFNEQAFMIFNNAIGAIHHLLMLEQLTVENLSVFQRVIFQ